MAETKPLLDGVRVLEFAILGPGALAGHLVDFGAEVIKIEAPSGDYVRNMTWPFANGVSLMHLHLNRGKQSLVLDLNVDEGRTVFEDLVRHSDVIIEGMRPGFLAKRGYTFARLQELNPKIVTCTLSGYGATGPYRDLPSHGIAYDAWAGTLQPVTDDDGFVRIPDQANIGITAGPAFGAFHSFTKVAETICGRARSSSSAFLVTNSSTWVNEIALPPLSLRPSSIPAMLMPLWPRMVPTAPTTPGTSRLCRIKI